MPCRYPDEPLTIAELAHIWGKDQRTIRTWLQGLPPDVKWSGGRGNASKWCFYRFMRHMGSSMPWIEIGLALHQKLDADDVSLIGQIIDGCRKSDAQNARRRKLLM